MFSMCGTAMARRSLSNGEVVPEIRFVPSLVEEVVFHTIRSLEQMGGGQFY